VEWDSQAADEFIKMPYAAAGKEGARAYAEKLARKNGSDKVTLKEFEETKKVYFAGVPEKVRIRELEKRIAEGEIDLRQRMEKEARDMLAREVDLCDIQLCHARNFRCRNQNIEVRELKLVSVCPNGCTAPESRDFGVAGVAKPMVTDGVCNECFTCVDTCRRRAILIRNGRPEIDVTRCDCCGQCVKLCPDDVLAYEDSGYKIWVGGHIGRIPQYGYVLFKMADKDTLFRALEVCVELIRPA
jgi:Pyruvate/2-oxoacid:ferredoxin oxidoreductase delta subunit